jgi:hypothetical protein
MTNFPLPIKKVLILIALLASVFLSLPTYSVDRKTNIYKEVFNHLFYQWEIKDYLGVKELARNIYKKTNDYRLKELSFLFYWLGSAFYHYHKGEFSKIVEDIGGLNLYLGYFKGKRYYEDLYYEFLGKCYILLFQYKRAVVFLIEAYKLKPLPRRFLDIIYATELAYYDELEPYYDVSTIKRLLKRVDRTKLNVFEKALYDFETGFYYLLSQNYKKALEYFKRAHKLDRAYLSDGQANFFMGKAYEGVGQYRDAYLYYKLALKQVKHPIFKLATLYRLFYVTAKLGYYQEANNYYYALSVLNPLPTNFYLQEITVKLWLTDNLLDFFFWKDSYDAIMARILWLNTNNHRGELAFLYFLNKFVKTGDPYPDFIYAWKLFEVKKFKKFSEFEKLINNWREEILKKPVKFYKNLLKLRVENRRLFNFFFGDYGKLALAYYHFYLGNFKKAERILESVALKHPLKFFIKGVIEATRGKPFYLETYIVNFPSDLKTESLFWSGYGYLLNNRWDIASLYWLQFLKRAKGEKYKLEKIFVLLHLAEHYKKLGYSDKAGILFKKLLQEIKNTEKYEGIKKIVSLQLLELGYKPEVKFMNKHWQNFLKYLQQRGK